MQSYLSKSVKTLRKLSTLVIILVITGSLEDAVAGGPCGKGHVCLWTHKDCTGRALRILSRKYNRVSFLGNLECPEKHNCTNKNGKYDGTWNDQMSSWKNASASVWHWYYHKNFGKPSFRMENHGTDRCVNLTREENDNASSLRR